MRGLLVIEKYKSKVSNHKAQNIKPGRIAKCYGALNYKL